MMKESMSFAGLAFVTKKKKCKFEYVEEHQSPFPYRCHFAGHNRPLHTHLSRVVSLWSSIIPPECLLSSPATAAATVGFMPEQLSCAAVLNERGHNSGAVSVVWENDE